MSVPEESKHCCLRADRISQLPDNVLDKILTNLPIVEAAKTTVLSKSWKRGWGSISSIVLDSSFGSKFQTAGCSKLMLVIYQILLLHAGPIDVFRLSIPWLECCPEIYQLIHLLSRKKVQHLTIYFFEGEFQILPSYLFSCHQLRTLDVIGCLLDPPRWFGGFNQLTKLVLRNVKITIDLFGMFVPNCPLLEVLSLERCCSVIKYFSIKVTALKLRSFSYDGPKLFFFFVSVPLLEHLQLYEDDPEPGSGGRLNFKGLKKLYLSELSSALPALRKLMVDYYFFKNLEVCNLSGESPHCLEQLKDLTVYFSWFAEYEEVSSLVGLIRSSPNLERLKIFVKYDEELKHYRILGLEEYDFSCNRLQTVVLYDFNGTNAEMMFVEALLLKSPQLKEMTIRIRGDNDQKELQILRKMIRFQRASPFVDLNLYRY